MLFPQQVRMSHTRTRSSPLPKHTRRLAHKSSWFSYQVPYGLTSAHSGCQRRSDAPEAFQELHGDAQHQRR